MNKKLEQLYLETEIELERVLSLPDRYVYEALKGTPSEILLLTLAGASSQLRERVFAVLSEKAQMLLADDLSAIGEVSTEALISARHHFIKRFDDMKIPSTLGRKLH